MTGLVAIVKKPEWSIVLANKGLFQDYMTRLTFNSHFGDKAFERERRRLPSYEHLGFTDGLQKEPLLACGERLLLNAPSLLRMMIRHATYRFGRDTSTDHLRWFIPLRSNDYQRAYAWLTRVAPVLFDRPAPCAGLTDIELTIVGLEREMRGDFWAAWHPERGFCARWAAMPDAERERLTRLVGIYGRPQG